MSAIRLLCPRVCVFQGGQLVFDGEPEAAIGEYYKTLSAADDGTGGGAAVVAIKSELHGVAGAEHYAQPDAEVELVTRVRFVQAVEDPHVRFEVLTEGGLLVSTSQSVLRRPWRVFRAGEEVDIRVRFRARFAGGSYRLVTIVTGANVDDQLLREEGPVVYVEPRVGTWGIVDPQATVEVDGEDRTWHESAMLDGRHGEQHPPV
jgi:hypothetical protein